MGFNSGLKGLTFFHLLLQADNHASSSTLLVFILPSVCVCATPTRFDLFSRVTEGMQANWTNGEVTVYVLQRVWKEYVFLKRSKAKRILG